MVKADQLNIKKENLSFIDPSTFRKNFINEIGNHYGSLTVLGAVRSPSDRKTLWACQCKCGRIIIVSGSDLRTNKYFSCGHRCDKIEDLTGQTINFLTVLKQDPTNPRQFPDHCVHWICKCNLCNTIKSVSGRLIKNGQAKSCGCLKSFGQQIIAQVLCTQGIQYKKEYSFDDLKSNKKSLLRFDFAVFKDQKLYGLIEYQGMQHFEPNRFFDTKEDFEQRILRDKQKEQYCKSHNIPLLIIKPSSDKDSNLTKEKITTIIINFMKGHNNEQISYQNL